jgi:hypothetical protein
VEPSGICEIFDVSFVFKNPVAFSILIILKIKNGGSPFSVAKTYSSTTKFVQAVGGRLVSDMVWNTCPKYSK